MKSPEIHLPSPFTVSHSLLKEWLTCRRKYLFNYLMRLTPLRMAVPLWIGNWFHRGIEKFYQHKDPDRFIPKILTKMERSVRKMGFLTPEDEESMARGIAMVEGMLTVYVEYYHKDLKRWDIVEPELRFEVPIGTNVKYVGIIDLVIRHKNKLRIMESKTAGRIDKNYVDRLPIDTQITGYAIGAGYALKQPVQKIIYNITKKSELRGRKGESTSALAKRIVEDYRARPEFYFHREELYRDKSTQQEFKSEISEMVRQIERAHAFVKNSSFDDLRGIFHKNTNSCVMPGRICEYLVLCTQGLKSGPLSQFRIREPFNPKSEDETSKKD